jgi:acyl dehydratase
LTDIFSHENIKELDVKFVAITRIGDSPIFNASVLRKKIHKNKRLLDLKISISDQNGDIKLDGTARIELNDES